MKRPFILISNDDGYQAKGIRELVSMVSPLGDILVCAPEGPRSGKSRAFTMSELTLRKIEDHGMGHGVTVYACSGTPVDCIKMANGTLCDRRPDLILSGINHGDNASTNAHYSGTVGVAFEGVIKGVPSIAFSLCDYDLDANFQPMKEIVQTLCRNVLEKGLPRFTFLNVNVPKVDDAAQLKGTRICRMAGGHWLNEVETIDGKTSEDGLQLYQLKGYFNGTEPDAVDTDVWALQHDFIAITPCTIDITAYGISDTIEQLLK